MLSIIKWLTNPEFRQHPERFCIHNNHWGSDCPCCEADMDQWHIRSELKTAGIIDPNQSWAA